MRRALSLLLCVLLIFSLPGCAAIPEHPLPILMYHNIVKDGEEVVGMTVTEGRFREDMQWLKDHGFTFVLPSELAAGNIPEKPVLVTFDDGYASSYEVLFPILQEMDVKVAVALIVSMTEKGDPSFLSWEKCREMAGSGLVEFGSHSYDLHNFDERGGNYVQGTANGIRHRDGETPDEYADRVWADLYKSLHAIQDNLGTEVCYFAYPFGVSDMWAEGFIRTHFPISVTTKSGIADLDDFRDMDRLTVSMQKSAADYLNRLA